MSKTMSNKIFKEVLKRKYGPRFRVSTEYSYKHNGRRSDFEVHVTMFKSESHSDDGVKITSSGITETAAYKAMFRKLEELGDLK